MSGKANSCLTRLLFRKDKVSPLPFYVAGRERKHYTTKVHTQTHLTSAFLIGANFFVRIIMSVCFVPQVPCQRVNLPLCTPVMRMGAEVTAPLIPNLDTAWRRESHPSWRAISVKIEKRDSKLLSCAKRRVCHIDIDYRYALNAPSFAFAKLRKATVSYVRSVGLPVGPHGTARLPLDGFSLNLIFDFFFWKYVEKFTFH